MASSVSIIGAGTVGCAWAAYLAQQGQRALLYADPHHVGLATTIREREYVEAIGAIDGRFKLTVGMNMCDVVQFSRFIVIALPAYGYDTALAELAKFDLRLHTVLAVAGRFFTLGARQKINANIIGEMSLSPFAARLQDGKVLVTSIKKYLAIAALPVALSAVQRDKIATICPAPLRWVSILEISLSEIGAVVHPAALLLNAGWVETTGGGFSFYGQGMSPFVVKVIENVDEERMAIGRAFGLELPSLADILSKSYGGDFPNLADFTRGTESFYGDLKITPARMQHRFIW